MHDDIGHLYRNDANIDFLRATYDKMPDHIQKKIQVLQRVRDVLLSSSIQYDCFSIVDLQGDGRAMFKDFGMQEEGIDMCFSYLIKMFDEFSLVSFDALEAEEARIISSYIFREAQEHSKN